MVRLTVPHRGSSLNVFTVHLHAGNQPSDGVTREHEIQRILYKIETEVGGPYLQVGDINFHGDEPGYAMLRHAQLIDCFRALHPHEAGVTYEGVHPPQRFDYLFASPGFPLTLTTCEVITTPDAKVASDHLPVVADFE